MFTALNENGRAIIVIDTGAVSRGSDTKNTDKEEIIRKSFVENDLLEFVILWPLFFLGLERLIPLA